MDLKETGCEGVNWIPVAQGMSNGGFCEHGNEISGSVNGG
jgi:hypothetical protein